MVRECEQGIEDVYHFFFECAYYTNIINQLQTRIRHVCTLAGNKGAPHWTVSLLLTPSSINTFSKAHCSDVLKATFEFIKHSGRCLWCRLSQLFVVLCHHQQLAVCTLSPGYLLKFSHLYCLWNYRIITKAIKHLFSDSTFHWWSSWVINDFIKWLTSQEFSICLDMTHQFWLSSDGILAHRAIWQAVRGRNTSSCHVTAIRML